MPILTSSDIFQLAADMPLISASAIKIASMIDNPRTSRKQIEDLVSMDSSVYAECFKKANAAAMRSDREVNNITDIINNLGLNFIKKVAVIMAAKSIIDDPTVWTESIFTAIGAQSFALKSGVPDAKADQIYMAGLFVNFGAFFLKVKYPGLYVKTINEDDFLMTMRAQRKEFGMTHPEIAALILEKYGLPSDVCGIIRGQADIYTGNISIENVCIEIARVFYNIEKPEAELLRESLNKDLVKEIIEKSTISAKDLDLFSLESITEQAQVMS